MNLSSGYPYDLIRNGIPYDYPKLEEDCISEVVIMGGGVTGALVAHYLQKAGIQSLLVDGRTIGLGSTCASTSLLQYEIDTPLFKLAEQVGREIAERSYHLCAKAISDLEKICDEIKFPDFQWCNSVYFAANRKDIGFLEEEFSARKKSGFEVSWLDATELEKKYGLKATAAIESTVGANTNAYLLTHALHQYHISKGMKVYDRTLVTDIHHHAKGVTLFTEEGYKISCKKLVYASGYESVKYIDKKIVQLAATYATVSEQFDAKNSMPDKAMFWNTAKPYLYTRQTNDNRMLVGGRDEPFVSAAKRDAMIMSKSRQLQKDFNRFFPTVHFKKEFSWSGIFGSTKDGLPFIGNYQKLPNGFFALGFGGNGITFSVMAAEIIKDLIAGRENNNAAFFSFARS
jgi:glycine/D-amino acid oxidase-like deaminating enzyme